MGVLPVWAWPPERLSIEGDTRTYAAIGEIKVRGTPIAGPRRGTHDRLVRLGHSQTVVLERVRP
jgi:hypothetical protein